MKGSAKGVKYLGFPPHVCTFSIGGLRRSIDSLARFDPFDVRSLFDFCLEKLCCSKQHSMASGQISSMPLRGSLMSKGSRRSLNFDKPPNYEMLVVGPVPKCLRNVVQLYYKVHNDAILQTLFRNSNFCQFYFSSFNLFLLRIERFQIHFGL